jgi:hypothetical protein
VEKISGSPRDKAKVTTGNQMMRWPGLPDFSWDNIPKEEKIQQTSTKYTKFPQNTPNDRLMTAKCNNIFHSKVFQNIPKFVIFGNENIWQTWH